mgnify:CR=1 FL=1
MFLMSVNQTYNQHGKLFAVAASTHQTRAHQLTRSRANVAIKAVVFLIVLSILSIFNKLACFGSIILGFSLAQEFGLDMVTDRRCGPSRCSDTENILSIVQESWTNCCITWQHESTGSFHKNTL